MPIVVTTTSTQAIKEIMHALKDQRISVLFKPFEVDDLYAAIRNFLKPTTSMSDTPEDNCQEIDGPDTI